MMNILSISALRKSKGPIWVLNTAPRSGNDRNYGDVLIEIRNPHPNIIKDIRKWAKSQKPKRDVTVNDLEAFMGQRTKGASFVSGKNGKGDAPKNAAQLAEQLIGAVERDEPLVEVRFLTLPRTWLPMCVTNEFKRKVLLNTPAFVKAVKEGTIAPIPESDALAMLAREDAAEELDRLDKQREARKIMADTTNLGLDPMRMMSGNIAGPESERFAHGVPLAFPWPRPVPGKAKTLRETPVEIVSYDDPYGMTSKVNEELQARTQDALAPNALEDAVASFQMPPPKKPWWQALLFWRR